MSTLHTFSAPRAVTLACAMCVLAACSSDPVHRQESFDPKSPYQYRVPAEPGLACNAAKLTLLSQGYVIDTPSQNQLKGSKSFQPEADRHVILDFNVHCVGTRNGTMLYANATESRFDLKKNSQSAGISIASVGGITLPWGTSSESLVKVAGLTVSDPQFYRRFYTLVEQELGINSQR